MTITDAGVYYDMYDREVFASPYETFRRLRNEAPVYYNEKYNFYALSRHDDLGRVLGDRETFISGKGMVYNIISMDFEMPPGLFITEDPPMHTVHRGIVSRMFTPRAVSGLEGQVRSLAEEIADDLVGRDEFPTSCATSACCGYPSRSSACWWACPRRTRTTSWRFSRRTCTRARQTPSSRCSRASSTLQRGSTSTSTGARRTPPTML